MTKIINNPFAEVIESSLQHWLIQSWEWNTFPSYGSLVVIEDKNQTLYGIVHHVQTGSMDPVRYPFAYKKSYEQLLQEQPQIFEFLKTTFTALPLGYKKKDRSHHSIVYQIPPEPPSIHMFVKPASAHDCQEFFRDPSYLHVLFGLSSHIATIDELLLAILQQLRQQSLVTPETLTPYIETYSLLIGDEYRRLKRFLQRTEKLLI